jgi:hypothetical protein
VFISKKWVDENIINDDNDVDDDNNDADDDNNDNESVDEITMAPGIIELKKSEKIKDNRGNILEIEIRGTREHDNCFFKVIDVAEGFKMKKLHDTLTKKNVNSYQNNVHYRFFYFSKNTTTSGKTKKVKKLYLTYIGLLKVLFSSRNKTVNNFVGWATETLFTAHLGTKEQKDKLSSKLMGISADIVKEVFNKTSSTLPVLYLLSIGKVKDLRVTLNISDEYDDEDIINKGGETIDLTRRIDEHNATYGKMPGANLCLKW